MSESVFYSVEGVRRMADRIINDYKKHFSFPETQAGFSPQESHLRDVVLDVLHEELNRLPSSSVLRKILEWDAENELHGSDAAYRGRIQSKASELAGVLHKQLLDTGLVTVQQWNSGIAPALVALDQAIESPHQWADRINEQEINNELRSMTAGPVTKADLIEALRQLTELKHIKRKIEAGTQNAAEQNYYEHNKETVWKFADAVILKLSASAPNTEPECICVAGLADPECPRHGMYSKQAAVFYSQATPTRADQLECVHGDPCAEDHTCRNHRILAEVEDAFRALCVRGWIPPVEK